MKDTVNKISQEDGQPDGIHISDGDGNLTIHDFLVNAGKNKNNVSDESFKHYEGYQKEFDNQLKEEGQFRKTLDVVNVGAHGHEAQ